jgi:hypothetical protein
MLRDATLSALRLVPGGAEDKQQTAELSSVPPVTCVALGSVRFSPGARESGPVGDSGQPLHRAQPRGVSRRAGIRSILGQAVVFVLEVEGPIRLP